MKKRSVIIITGLWMIRCIAGAELFFTTDGFESPEYTVGTVVGQTVDGRNMAGVGSGR